MGECVESGCTDPAWCRRMCGRHYRRWWRAQNPDYVTPSVVAKRQARQLHQTFGEDKRSYLASLSPGELTAFCTGVLARASVTPGDPHEVAELISLVRHAGPSHPAAKETR